MRRQLSTNDTSIDRLQSHSLERFLVDSDINPELVVLLRKVGFKATHAAWQQIPNDDTEYLVWARKHCYILVCHDKHRDTKTRYSFYSEMYYRERQVISSWQTRTIGIASTWRDTWHKRHVWRGMFWQGQRRGCCASFWVQLHRCPEAV